MSEQNDPPTPPEGETDAEKTTRENAEREANAAEAKVAAIVDKAVAAAFKKHAPPPSSGSSAPAKPQGRKSALDIILGR